eukprot:8477128-Alexandrium_andersonii.AAC.1
MGNAPGDGTDAAGGADPGAAPPHEMAPAETTPESGLAAADASGGSAEEGAKGGASASPGQETVGPMGAGL